MAGELVPFTELLSKIVDNRGRTCPTAETGLPLIATNCIRNEHLYPAFDNVRYVSKDTYDHWFRGHPEPGDLIFTCKGTPGRVCMTPDPVPFCIAQDMVALRADPKKVHPKFLFALLRSKSVQDQIGNMHVGTLIPHFKKGDFHRLLLPVPEMRTQEFIGNTYYELSLLIDLNRETNEILEEMARALFKSWFVDFDPVRAKLEGRPPAGMDAATAAVFPDHFQDSELGQIPKGWEVVMVKDAFNLTMGQSPPGESYNESGDGLPFYQGRTDFGFRFPTRRKFCTAPTRLAKLGDTLVSVRAPVGDINMADEECCIGRGVAAVRHKSGATSFTYHSMANFSPEFSVFEGEGTVFGSINKQSFESLRCVSPPPEIVFAYEEIAGKIDDLIGSNLHESHDLAALRDTLLPKLLSGELSAS